MSSQIPSQASSASGKPSQDETTWAVMAHASALLNLLTSGFGGPVAAALIWLAFRGKSRRVAFHGLQSLYFQLIQLAVVVVLVGAIWVIGFAFSFATIGFGTLLAVPVMILSFFLAGFLLLAGMAFSIYAAFQVGSGQDFQYPVVGEWARRGV